MRVSGTLDDRRAGIPGGGPDLAEDLPYNGLCSHAAMFERHPPSAIVSEAQSLHEFRLWLAEKNKAEKTHFCDLCGIAFGESSILRLHLLSRNHAQKAGTSTGEFRELERQAKPYACDICD